MSSSVLQNVIQPKYTPPSILRAGLEDFGADDKPPEDMELVLGVLVENAPVAMAMFDDQMRYVLANRAWVEEFSLQGVTGLIGRSQYEVFPGMHPGWKQVYDRALQGHVVRSEHDALSGPDGRRLVYRWEVRPWRRQRDAGVGGLMVTCEKFGNAAAIQAITPQEVHSEPAQEQPKTPNLAQCGLPMVLLDEKGILHQTNSAAAELGLAKGIQEGVSTFWDVFADAREASRLQWQWGGILEKLGFNSQLTGLVMEVPALQGQTFPEVEKLPPQRWLISPCLSEAGKRYLAMLLPALPVPEPTSRQTFLTPPNLPAIANAVAAISQPQIGNEGASQTLELRRLQDELARARQELRTLHGAERVFTQRESRVRHYLDSLPCGVLVLDDLGTPIYQNEPLMKLLGRSIQREETVENWLGAACPNVEHRAEVTTLWREDVWRRQLTRTFSLATADGLLKELEFQPSSLQGGGLLVCIQDVTENCRHEEQLRATEAKFRTLLHESPIPVVLMDKVGAVFEVNHHAENLLGHPKTELRRFPLDTWLEPEDARARREALRQMLETGERSTSLEVRIRQSNREPILMLLTLAQVLDSSGEPHCTVHFFQKKEAVSPHRGFSQPVALANASALFRSEAVPQTWLRTNVNGRIKEITALGMKRLGLTEAEAKGRSLHLHFRPSDPTGFYAELARLAQIPTTISEMACFDKDGNRQVYRLRVAASGGGGLDFELTEMAADKHQDQIESPAPEILIQAPQAIFQTLLSSTWPVADLSREKLLLSETHHRIKNHLQIISSLLNLESNTIVEPTARVALLSSQNRVRAIAELHQHLYQIALGTAESFGVFADGLVQRLRNCYDVMPERVAVRLDLEQGSVQQEWLMPLALTLNETLSNCFEHAFPGDRQGVVHVRLTFGPDSGQLVVRDDGVGLPVGFSAASSTGLGLKILAVFAEQMRGKLSLGATNSGGTEIQLRFPIAYADI